MKVASSTAFLAIAYLALPASVGGVEFTVGSCAEIADVDDTTITSLTITTSPFECDSYTRFPVRNEMTIKSDFDLVFSNFALKVLGGLTVEPNVIFMGVTEQEKNGGALKVEKGATATFMGTSFFTGNSIKIPDYVGSTYIRRKGGAIHNKGELVFEGDSSFTGNSALTPDSTTTARGGAISNSASGSITFKSKLAMDGNVAKGNFEGQGGAIFNRGIILVEGDSSFTDNSSAAGGAIFARPWGTITFNSMATFTENVAKDNTGGAIASFGALNLLGGSLFKDNYADSAGDGGSGGAIYNGGKGIVTFGGGDTTFDGNWGRWGGAIVNDVLSSMTPPDDGDIVFLNSDGDICPEIAYAQADGSFICGP